MRKHFSKRVVGLIVSAVVLLTAGLLSAAYVGQVLPNVKIRNSHNNPTWILDMGKKVLTIMYNDYEAQNTADPIADALKARKYPDAKYRGMGIANLKDNPWWAADAVVRPIVRSKERKYNSVILLDPDHSLKKKWNLGACDNASIVLIIGVDRKVKYVKRFPAKSKPSAADINKVLSICDKLIGR